MRDKVILNEARRIKELGSYEILDTDSEKAYDDIVALASEICETPIALVTLVDSDRQWFKSRKGIEPAELPRASAFCSHAILEPNELFLVENAQTDERFTNNPLVTGDPYIRFYAGAPLVTESGEAMGTLCVIDHKPRQLNDNQKLALRVLARQVVAQLQLRRTIQQMRKAEEQQKKVEKALRESEARFKAFMDNNPAVAYMKDEDGQIVYTNKVFERLFDFRENELLGKTDFDYLPVEIAAAIRRNDQMVLSKWEPVEALENIPTPDGSASHWLSLKFPFINNDGKKFLGGVSIDVTARKIAEEKQNESERRYRQLFEFSPGFINLHNLDGIIIEVNESGARALGYEPKEIIGKSLADFLTPNSLPFFADYLRQINQASFTEGMMHLLTRNGDRRIWQYRNRLFTNTDGSAYVIGYAQDITELKKTQEELKGLTLTDDLTKMYNRRGFFTLAAQALRYARRNDKTCLAIYADLDNLKQVNDQFGHETGSQMIVDAATVFKSFFRDSDIVARLGGDEFAILAQDGSVGGTEIIKERLQKLVAKFNRENVRPFSLSISFGIAEFDPKSEKTIERLISEADKLMYSHKQAKRSSFEKQPLQTLQTAGSIFG